MGCLFAFVCFVCLCSYMSCRHAIQNPLFPKFTCHILSLFVYNFEQLTVSLFKIVDISNFVLISFWVHLLMVLDNWPCLCSKLLTFQILF
jgi:hypothetical protein